ncbi:MAG: hypothetical protein IPN17_00390 [Deltaproteobacteria bacterium]|nr:hypothetical protein [Deltaproteobacteria bacterium]
MTETVDASAIRRALDQSRGQRTQITRGAPLPIDTAHVVGACPNCGHLGATILGFPDPPYAGPQGQPRYRGAKELTKFVEELFKNPPPLPAAEDPSEASKTVGQPPNWKGLCVCGAKIMPPQPDPRTGEMVSVEGATPRRVCGVRFIKAMPGSGSELVVEALSGGDGGVPYTDGVVIRTRLLRAPLDGAETEVSDTVDDETIEKTFGRPLTLAKTWKIALDAAAKGEEVIKEVEPGYWIWAGPKEDAGLEQRVKDLVGEDKQKAAFPLAMLPQMAPMPQGPAFPQWAYEHSEAIQKGDLRAGVVMDQAATRKLLQGQMERVGLGWQEQNDGMVLVATAGELLWPMEVPIVALGAAHLGWFLGETTAAAVGETMARITEVKRFADAVRAERPEITFQAQGTQLIPKRADGTLGRALNLMDMPFRMPPGSKDFKREIRFACDELPKNLDPTRWCPCGDKAWVCARIFPARVVEQFKQATQGKSPKIIEQWNDALLVAVISDDRHVRIPTQEELEGAGLKGDIFDRRLAEELPNSIFAVDVSMHEDKNQKRALLAFGPLVASVVINDHLISALHGACGKPLRGDEVSAVVTTPNVICLHEPGFDDDRLEQVLDMGAATDGIPANVDPPFDLSWDVSLTAAPVGRFVNLNPAPPGQGPQQGPQAQAQAPRGR